MSLTLITGPVASGKTESVLTRLEPYAGRQAGLCIVPSDAASFELRKRFLKGRKAVLGDVFISYNHFIKKIADADLPVMSQGEQILLLYKILSGHKLSYFKSASLGIARQAAEAITTLKKNFISCSMFAEMLGARKAQREQDLLRLFEIYEKEKSAAHLLDDGDLTFVAAKKIKDSPMLEGIEYVAFDELHHFGPGQLNLIELLARNFGHMKIEITFPVTQDKDALFAPYLEKTLNALKKIASGIVDVKRDRTVEPEIRNVVLRSPFQETRFVAREIAAAAGKGIEPSEIAVCLRRGDRRLPVLLKELEELGLASETHRIGTIFSSPVMHESLSEKTASRLPESATVDEFAAAVIQNLKRAHDVAALEQAKEIEGPTARSMIAFYSVEQMLKSLATTSRTLSIERISRETFLNILYHNCLSFFASSNEISQVTPVNVAAFEDGLARSPRLLFMPQLMEGNIPSPFSDRLFFPSEDRVGENFSDIFSTPSDNLAEEAFLFHRFLSKTSEKVVLSHPAIDHSGREAAPSGFLDPFDEPVPVDIPASGKEPDRLRDIIAIERERTTGDAIHPQYHGRLTGKKVREMIRKRFTENPVSPSQIEAYAECPFRFFVEHVLNLRPPEEITPELQPKDMGTIIHAILERFYKDHLDVFKKYVADSIATATLERTLDNVVDEVFDEHVKLIGYVAVGLKPFERKSARTLARQVILDEVETARSLPEPLLPVRCEWAFGTTPQTRLAIEVEGEPDALIRGRVDRIDTSDDESKFTVVDYKTGRTIEAVANKIKNGLHFQLPLYVEAVRRFLFPKSTPLGGVIFAVRQPEKKHGFLKKSFNEIHYSIAKRSSSIMEDESWDNLLAGALNAAAKHCAAIRGADFSVRPRECPRYCDYEDVCRYSKAADAVTAAGD